jgi:hypothetical protein
MFLISFYEIPKGVQKHKILIGLLSFGKVMGLKRNIDLLNETLLVDQKIKGV